MSIDISIVSPLYNEEDNVQFFVESIVESVSNLGMTYEIILVDDGSADNTWSRMSSLTKDYPEVVTVKLSRNFGHQGALLAGLSIAKGKAIVSLDGDMQHPPSLIPELVEKWKNGAKIVLTKRIDSEKTTAFKSWSSKTFYRLFSLVADTKIDSGSSDFRLLDIQVLKKLLALRYGQPFLRGAVQTLGFETATVEYLVGERFSGQSKFTLKKMVNFARSGIISHSHVPLRCGIYLGLLTGILSFIELVYVLVQWAAGNTVQGWASTLGLVSMLFSIVFIILGLMGMYIEDLHILLKQSPHFIIAEVVGREYEPVD